MSIRRTALETLTEITDKGAYANLTLKRCADWRSGTQNG